MPVVNIDGQKVTFPDTMSAAEIESVLQDYYAERKQDVSQLREAESTDYGNMPLSDVAISAAKNLPSSVGGLISDVASAVASPLETANTITQLGAGVLQNILPESVVETIGKDERSIKVANAVGQMMIDRYGSQEGFRKALAEDPASVMGDVATVLGIGGVATKSEVLNKAAAMAEPLAVASKVAEKTASTVGKIGSEVLGKATGAGATPIREAFGAGAEGGKRGELFAGSMRGDIPVENVLNDAKANLQQLRIKRNQQYSQMMEGVKSDPTILGFGGIDEAIGSALDRTKFGDKIKDEKAYDAVQNVINIVNDWKESDPARYHTPEGFDALKQRIGAEADKLPFEAKNARTVVNDIYSAVRSDIAKQAPVYDKVMKGYSEATETIREVERALSLNDRASADTALRKLQSTMRSNVNTNFGQREKLLNEIEGLPNQLKPQLAGQALEDWTPRGIQGATMGLTGYGAYSVGGLPAAIATAAASSPRLAGEAAYAAGRGGKAITDLAKAAQQRFPYISDPKLRIMLYQAEQAKQQSENE